MFATLTWFFPILGRLRGPAESSDIYYDAVYKPTMESMLNRYTFRSIGKGGMDEEDIEKFLREEAVSLEDVAFFLHKEGTIDNADPVEASQHLLDLANSGNP